MLDFVSKERDEGRIPPYSSFVTYARTEIYPLLQYRYYVSNATSASSQAEYDKTILRHALMNFNNFFTKSVEVCLRYAMDDINYKEYIKPYKAHLKTALLQEYKKLL
jgi:hypothetical protein